MRRCSWQRAAAAIPAWFAPAALALAVGGGLLPAGLRRRARPARPAPRRLGRAEWAIARGAVFACFPAVQFATPFGGHDHASQADV